MNLTNNINKPAYKDPTLPIEKRVEDLVYAESRPNVSYR